MTTQLSLAGWSIHRRFLRQNDRLLLLDFPRVAQQEFGFSAIELNDPFFASTSAEYLNQLNHAAAAEGISMLNVAIDMQGDLSADDVAQRQEAVEKHRRWLDIAVTLGCNAIRANPGGYGKPVTETLIAHCTESYAALAEAGGKLGITVMVENHGSISGNPDIVVRMVREINSPWFATLPDFGNFPDDIRYDALTKIAPYAHAVHAKMFEFGPDGEDTRLDIGRCIRILRTAGYRGPFGIEYEGEGDDHEGVLKSKSLVERYL